MSQPADSPDSQPTPAEQPADAAHAGTPHYGTFGDPANVPATPEHHPNRQYVGGYMDPEGTHGGCETGPYEPSQQRGHVRVDVLQHLGRSGRRKRGRGRGRST